MKVVLIGDSIRMGYQPLVAAKLAGEAEVWGPAANCRHSLWALDHFDAWVVTQAPDILHVNFGIHDQSTMPDGECQILLAQYRLCLRRFLARTRELDSVRMIWATSTPLRAGGPDTPKRDWQPRGLVEEYNAAALELVNAEGLMVDDLHGAVLGAGFWNCLSDDGCHMTEAGNDVLSDAVVDSVRRARAEGASHTSLG